MTNKMNYAQIKKLDEKSAEKMKEGKGPVDECICHILAPDDKKSIKSSIKKAFAKVKDSKKKNRVASPLGPEIDDLGLGPGFAGPAGRAGSPGGLPVYGHRTGRAGSPGPGFGSIGSRASAMGPDGFLGYLKHSAPRSSPVHEIDIPLGLTRGTKGGMHSTRQKIRGKGSCGKCGCDKEDFYLKHSYASIRITTPDLSSICPCPTPDCMPEKLKLANSGIKVTVERLTIDTDNKVSKSSIPPQNTVSEPVMLQHKSLTSLVKAQYETDESRQDILEKITHES